MFCCSCCHPRGGGRDCHLISFISFLNTHTVILVCERIRIPALHGPGILWTLPTHPGAVISASLERSVHSFIHSFIPSTSAFYMVGTVLGPFSRNLPAGRTDRRHGCTSSSECSEVKKEVDNRAWGMGCCLQRVAKEGDFSTKTEIKVLRRAEETGGGLRWGRGGYWCDEQ